ncbi:RIP homotypic interaction motif-containing protein [Streptomyces sp. NPDC003758]
MREWRPAAKVFVAVCIVAWLLARTDHVRRVVLPALRDGLLHVGLFAGGVLAAVVTGMLVIRGARTARRGLLSRRAVRAAGRGSRSGAVAVRTAGDAPARAPGTPARPSAMTPAHRVPAPPDQVRSEDRAQSASGSPTAERRDDDRRATAGTAQLDALGVAFGPIPAPAVGGPPAPRTDLPRRSPARAADTTPAAGAVDGARAASTRETSPTSPKVMVIGCRAVQVGSHNWQFLHFRCDLRAQVDFGSVLRRLDVQEDLAELALDPENGKLRDRVMRHLCHRWQFLGSKALELRRVERLNGSGYAQVTPGERVLDRLCEPDTGSMVVVRDCDGVQIGDHCRQTAEFAYVCKRPRIDEVTLLEENPAVAGALVDMMIGGAEPGPTDALHAELDSALRSYEVRFWEPGTVSRGRDGLCVEGLEGVSVGWDNVVVCSEELRPEVHVSSIAPAYNRLTERVMRKVALLPDEEARRAVVRDAPQAGRTDELGRLPDDAPSPPEVPDAHGPDRPSGLGLGGGGI